MACSDESSAESEGYWSVDKELRRVIERTFKVTDERMEKEGQDSGSTAVVALVGRENIVIANCGDSKAVLSRGCDVDPIVLTAEHRPHDHQVDYIFLDKESRIEMSAIFLFICLWFGKLVLPFPLLPSKMSSTRRKGKE